MKNKHEITTEKHALKEMFWFFIWKCSQLTGMEFHILEAACEKAMIKQTPIYNTQVQQVTISCTLFIVEVT